MNLSRQAMQRYVRERPLDALAAEDAAYLGGDGSAIALRSAMARLDERSRALCDLIGLEQLSYSEAAERLGLPIGSVGPLYMRAKERLRRELW